MAHRPEQTARAAARQDRRAVWAVLVLLVLLWAGALTYLFSTYQTQTGMLQSSAAEQLNQRTELLALMQSELLDTQLRQTDSALQTLARELRLGDAVPLERQLTELMVTLRDTDDEVADILVTDADGNGVFWTSPAPPPNVADREYFQVHQVQQTPQPYVSLPINPRMPEHDLLIVISRPWYHTNGDFGGVVAAGLPVETLARSLNAINLNGRIRSLVAHEDGEIIFRSPYSDFEPGQQLGLLRGDRSLPHSGSRILADTDGEGDLQIAWQHLPRWQVYVLVGENIDPLRTAVAGFNRSQRWLLVAVGLTATLLILLLAWLLIRRAVHLQNLRRREQALVISEERNRAIVNAIPDLLFTVDESGTILDYQAGENINLSGNHSEVLGHSITSLLPETVARTALSCVSVTLKTGELQTFDYTRRADGAISYYQARTVRLNDDRVMMIIIDITAQKSAEIELQWQASHDSLTHLPNRLLFYDRLNHALEQQNRYERPFCLLYMDLNGFKQVNDEHGHNAGDELLEQVARRLKRQVRAVDTLARLAGDEFAVIATECHRVDAEVLAQKLRDTFAEPFELDGVTVQSTISIGIAQCPDDGTHPDTLVRVADEAMYDDKQKSRRANE